MNNVEKLKGLGYKVDVIHYRYTQEDWNKVKKNLRDFRCRIKKSFKTILEEKDFNLDAMATGLSEPIPYPQIVEKQDISPRGGQTFVKIEKDGKTAYGKAVCSWEDNFNRSIGVNRALGRAVNSLALIDSICLGSGQ